MKEKLSCMIICAAMFVSLLAAAAKADDADKVVSTEELYFMEIPPVLVASWTHKTLTTAPGIVSVITREEIENSGARTLDDLLMFVPGYMPAMDQKNSEGCGIRGLWANNGKVLVMIDGIQMNDPLYGAISFGGQFFTDNIDHIEIIRGPGSAMYGNFAELGVINIITRGAQQKGGSVSLTYGQMDTTFGRRVASVSYGNTLKDLAFSVNATAGDGHLGDGTTLNAYTLEPYAMSDYSGQRYWQANVWVQYKGLSLRFIDSSLKQDAPIFGNFNNTTNTYDPAPGIASSNLFDTYTAEAKYVIHLRDNLTLTPGASYSKSYAWYQGDDSLVDINTGFYRPVHLQEYKGGLTASWDITDKINMTAGAESARDQAEETPSQHALDVMGFNAFVFFITDSLQASDNTQSVFAEVNARTDIADITIGGRNEQSGQFGSASVPRLALTREFGDYNVKCLASRAYRAPTVMELFWQNPSLKPEYTTTYEVEFGRKLTKDAYMAVNLFDEKTENIITYAANNAEYVANGYWAYANRDVTASRGVEAQYRIRKDWGYCNLAYSYYKAYDNTVFETTPTDAQGNTVGDVTLGFPTHKATLNASVKIGRGWSAAPGLIWFSNRYASYTDDSGNPHYKTLDPEFLANLYFRHVFATNGWELGLGVFNLFDQQYWMAHGSYDDYSETSGPSREYVMKVKYSF